MAIDFTHPITSDLYSSGTGTDWPGYLQDNIAAAAMWLEGIDPPGKRAGFKRVGPSNVLQRWSGSAWVSQPLSLAGGTVIGGAAGDPLTINSNTVNVPNGLTFTGGPVALAGALAVSGGGTIASLAEWNTKAAFQVGLVNPGVRFGVGYTASDQVNLQGYASDNSVRNLVLQQFGGRVGVGVVPHTAVDILSGSNRYQVTSGGGALFTDSVTAAADAFLPHVRRAQSHTWHVGASQPAMHLFSDGNLSLSSGGSSYGGRLTVIPISNPGTFAAAKQISIGESSGNADYRLQLGYTVPDGAWVGSISAYAGGATTTLHLNPEGGRVNVGNASVSGAYGFAVSGPLVLGGSHAAALNGIVGTTSTGDVFAHEGNVLSHYGLTWKTVPSAPSGLSALLTAYGDVRMFTAGVETLRVTSGGLIYNMREGQELGFRNLPRVVVTAAYNVLDSDRGKLIIMGSGASVNVQAGFVATDGIVSFINASGGVLTLNQGSGMSLYTAGTSTAGNKTLAPNAMGTIYFYSASVAVVNGAGVT